MIAELILAQAAGPICGPTHEIYDSLAPSQEERIYAGLSGQAFFETWANPSTGTWTTLLTTPDGTSCVMAVGDNFFVFGRKPNL